MPTMFRTSSKARKIALAILGKPMNYENKAQKQKDKERSLMLLRDDLRKSR